MKASENETFCSTKGGRRLHRTATPFFALAVAGCSHPRAEQNVRADAGGCPVGTHAEGKQCAADDASALTLTEGARAPAPSSCPKGMLGVPGGAFAMKKGEERPLLTVAPFCLDETEVTVEAYGACVAAKKCAAPEREDASASACNWGRGEAKAHPVNCVDWYQATSYCEWRGARLPSEEEWVWAARGGDRALTYPWGNEDPDPTRLNACDQECWEWHKRTAVHSWDDNPAPIYPKSDGWPTTSPVGAFPKGRSPLGFLDLAGNVEEWTSSDYGGRYKGNPVVHGGSWMGTFPSEFKVTARAIPSSPNVKGSVDGIRCAK